MQSVLSRQGIEKELEFYLKENIIYQEKLNSVELRKINNTNFDLGDSLDVNKSSDELSHRSNVN